MIKTEKLAVWVICLANPLIGWAVTYLLWHDSHPAKQRYAARIALYVFLFIVAAAVLAALFGPRK